MAYNLAMFFGNVSGLRSHSALMAVIVLMLICTWIHGSRRAKALKEEDQRAAKASNQIPGAPLGYKFCKDNPPQRVPHQDVTLSAALPERSRTVLEGGKHIVFRPGKTEVDVYKSDIGRVIRTEGIVHREEKGLVLTTKLHMSDWPAGYVVGVQADPVFAYCTLDFVLPPSKVSIFQYRENR